MSEADLRAQALEREVRRLSALLEEQSRQSFIGPSLKSRLAAPGAQEWQIRTDRAGERVRFVDARLAGLLDLPEPPPDDALLASVDVLPGAPGLLAQMVAEALARPGTTVERAHALPAREGQAERHVSLKATGTPSGVVLVLADDTRRRRLTQWFGRYASPAVLDALEQRPEDFFRLREVEATLLFIDLVNYSGSVARLEPEQVGRLLNTFFRVGIQVVEHHQGMVVQFVGDELMVVFGAPLALPTPALTAARCALALLAAHDTVRAAWRAQGLPELGVRIGLSTGKALAGNLGDERRASWCVVGHPTNLAARMLAAAEPGQALATQSLVDAAEREAALSPPRSSERPRFVLLPERVQAKNLGSVVAYRVERAEAARS